MVKSTPSTSQASQEVLAPRSTNLEFGGFYGALFVSTTVPLTLVYLTYGCNETLGCALSLPVTHTRTFLEYAQREMLAGLFDKTAWALYIGWYAYCVLAWYILPGSVVKGLPLRTALATGLVAFGGVATYIAVYGPESFTVLYDHWSGLLLAAFANSVVQAVYVYAASFNGQKLLAIAGNSGNVVYDWFIGRELNPRIGSFDIKTFNELRPGLIMWVILDVSCACKQYATFGSVSGSMALVLLFHAWYVVDSLLHEQTIFSQMDITTDGFGFMLSVGDLVWVPFTYSLQARYLAFEPASLGAAGIVAILAVQFVGFYIFRTANAEKNDFRQGRNPKNLQYLTTSRGSKLLVSGWWGRSRHPNYLGDWLMGWAWCLPCGFRSPVPYFYVAYFAVLLVHRQMRDDEACKQKYGNEYVPASTDHTLGATVGTPMYVPCLLTQCKRVPYRIIPYIY